jgi:DNA-binding IclR family transcriptional regulator
MAAETSLGKALRLLSVVGEATDSAGISVAEMIEKTGLSRPTVYRLLRELQEFQLVRSVPRRPVWQLGSKVIALAAVAGSWSVLRRRIKQEMDDFVRQMGFTVHLAIRDGFDIVYIDKSESAAHMTISSVIGSRRPLNVTALGKCLVAFDSDPRLAEKVADHGLVSRTPHSITDRTHWLDEIAWVKAARYAYDRGEAELAARCIAAPICDPYGHAVAAISFSALKDLTDDAEFEHRGAALRELAQKITAEA